MFCYSRDSLDWKNNKSKNRGDVFSLAYAAYHKVLYFSSRDASVMNALFEVKELKDVQYYGFEECLVIGYIANKDFKEVRKRIKSLYKEYCIPAIKKGFIPKTLLEYINEKFFSENK